MDIKNYFNILAIVQHIMDKTKLRSFVAIINYFNELGLKKDMNFHTPLKLLKKILKSI